MTDKLFDDFIKGKIQNATAPVNKALWDKIIAQDEKKRRGLWWLNTNLLWVGIGLLLLSGAGYFALSTTNKKDETKLVDTKNSIETTNSKLQVKDKNVEQETANSNIIVTNKNKQEEIKSVDENTTSTLKESVEKLSVGKASTKTEEVDFAPTPFSNAKPLYNNRKITSTLNKKENRNLAFNTVTTTKPLLSDDSNTDLSNNDFYTSSFNFKAGNTANLQKIMLNSNNEARPFPFINMRKLLGLNGDDCGSYMPKDFYVEAYGSADFSKKKVTNISTTDNYLRRKDSAESQQMGFTTGFRFAKNLTENWYIKAGLQFSQINELFTTSVENERRQTIVITTRTLIRMGLPDTTISDTSSLLQIGYKTQRFQNRYSSLEVPILLSYETGNLESNWKFAITGGLIINATTWYSGNTYDDNFNVVNLKPANNGAGFYRHQLGFSAYVSASVIKKLSPAFSLFAEPYYRVGINKNNISAGFTQQFNTMGATIGLRYKLNK